MSRMIDSLVISLCYKMPSALSCFDYPTHRTVDESVFQKVTVKIEFLRTLVYRKGDFGGGIDVKCTRIFPANKSCLSRCLGDENLWRHG